MALGIVVPLFVPLAALGASVIIGPALRIDFALAFILTVFGGLIVIVASSGYINTWTARYLAENPMAKTLLVVKAVRPRTFGWHEIRGVANDREIVLAVRGDRKLLDETLAATGFTAKKQRKSG